MSFKRPEEMKAANEAADAAAVEAWLPHLRKYVERMLPGAARGGCEVYLDYAFDYDVGHALGLPHASRAAVHQAADVVVSELRSAGWKAKRAEARCSVYGSVRDVIEVTP